VALLLGAVHAGTLQAHHAYTTVFDASKTVTLSGTLTKVDWRNPHIEFVLDAKNSQGQVEGWIVEAGPPSYFTRNKVARADFEKAIGQTVTIEIYRARDGTLLGSLLKITFSDGRSIASNPQA
jgi:hypothetical protein